ncbi:MAG: hypothetical protein ACRDSH_06525 [Pseudonocardiaceae bacterium]
MRDIVQVHITSALPIRAQALPFANRVEVRFGKAFPVALIVDRDALDQLIDAIGTGRKGLYLSEVKEEEDGHDGRG